MPDTSRVLLTGAAGTIGAVLRPRLARPTRLMRLVDIAKIDVANDNEEYVNASVTDLGSMERACEDVDAVIHLGGIKTEASWADISAVNIEGTYNIFEAARRRGVKRVVFASSNHAVGFFPRDQGLAPDYLFPTPDTYYGVSKVTGEAIGSLYHNRFGLDVICLRILSCRERPTDLRSLATWLSPNDTGRLFEAALSVDHPGFRVVWGVSANMRSWFSSEEGRSIGYVPQDNAELFAAEITARLGEPDLNDPEHHLLGGRLCAPAFDPPLA